MSEHFTNNDVYKIVQQLRVDWAVWRGELASLSLRGLMSAAGRDCVFSPVPCHAVDLWFDRIASSPQTSSSPHPFTSPSSSLLSRCPETDASLPCFL